MYRYLEKRILDCKKSNNEQRIQNCDFLLQQLGKYFSEWTRNGEIDIKKLDFTMYMQIYKLAEGTKYVDLFKYMNTVRNELCHVPFELISQGMTIEEFKADLKSMVRHLKSFGAKTTWVDYCINDLYIRENIQQ